MLIVERHYITGTEEIVRLCKTSKELYNRCTFLMRQAWFGGHPLPDINQLVQETQSEECFKNLHNTKTAKQTVRKVLTDWSNFKKARKAYEKDPSKFVRQPKPPYYKDKLAQVIFYNETVKKKPLKFGIVMPTNDLFSVNSSRNFKQVVVTPKTFGFMVEIQYERPNEKQKVSKDKIACIDLGVNNLCTITLGQLGKPILVNGRILKAHNQLYNKRPSQKASRKRYFRIENYFHHASKFIVQTCLKHGIGRLIIGKNDGWKREVKMRQPQKQNFQYIPFYNLLQKIRYKAEAVGIEVAFTEEAYTSQSSFLDRDPLPAYEKGVSHKFSGDRKHRGLYISSDKYALNADVNGSLNIGRKVVPEFSLRIGDRSLAARPVRIDPTKVRCV
jgi:IS605 OrfB family transposase